MYSFNHPQAAWILLLFIPLGLGFIWLNHYRTTQLNRFSALISALVTTRSFSITLTKQIAWGFIWILCCVALMEPIGNIQHLSSNTQENQIISQSSQEIIFLIDTSASMSVKDGFNKETRLEEGKKIITDILRRLKGQNTSLYAFTSILTPVVPPTLDYLFMRLSIMELHIDEGDVGGTNFEKTLHTLKEEVFSQPTLQHYSIILLSDGEDQGFENFSMENKNQQIERVLKQLPDPSIHSFNFYTIGLGSSTRSPIPHAFLDGKPVLSKLDPEILMRLAEKGKGTYYEASKWNSLNLAEDLNKKIRRNFQNQKLQDKPTNPLMSQDDDIQFDVYFQVPLFIALLFYSLNLLLPDVRRKE